MGLARSASICLVLLALLSWFEIVADENWRRLASSGTENGITSAAHSQCIQWPHSPCQSDSFLGRWMTFLKFQSFWESLERLLCSARIPRGFLNGVALLSKGIHSSFLFISTNNCTCKFRLSNIVNSTSWKVRLTIPPPPLVELYLQFRMLFCLHSHLLMWVISDHMEYIIARLQRSIEMLEVIRFCQ